MKYEQPFYVWIAQARHKMEMITSPPIEDGQHFDRCWLIARDVVLIRSAYEDYWADEEEMKRKLVKEIMAKYSIEISLKCPRKAGFFAENQLIEKPYRMGDYGTFGRGART